MNNLKRIAALLYLVVAMAVSSCAPQTVPATDVAPTTEAVATEASAPAEVVTLSVMANGSGIQIELLEKIARQFEQENPDIKIEFSAPGKDYESLLKIKMAANDMPDVFATHGWAKVRYGAFLTDLADQPWASQIDAAIAPAVTDEAGKVYVLPMDQQKTGPVYNVDILSQYGVEVPLTWADLLAACETIKTGSNGDVDCIHMGGADSWPVGQYYDFMSTSLAISPQNNDAQALLDGTYDWAKYTVISENLLELQEKGYLNTDVLTAKYSDSAAALAEGKAAFGLYGPFICEEALKTNPDLNCGLMPIPTLQDGDTPTFAGGELTTWGVWKDSKHQEAAKARQRAFARTSAKYADLRTFDYFDRVYLPNGMWDVLCKNGQDVLAGGATPEQATENIAKEFDRLRAGQ